MNNNKGFNKFNNSINEIRNKIKKLEDSKGWVSWGLGRNAGINIQINKLKEKLRKLKNERSVAAPAPAPVRELPPHLINSMAQYQLKHPRNTAGEYIKQENGTWKKIRGGSRKKTTKKTTKRKTTKRKTTKKTTRKPKVHKGPRGGKYIIRKGKKVYV